MEQTRTQNVKVSNYHTFNQVCKHSDLEDSNPTLEKKVPNENQAIEPYNFSQLVKKGPFEKKVPPLIILLETDNSFHKGDFLQRQVTFDSPLNAEHQKEDKSPNSARSSTSTENPFQSPRGFPHPNGQTHASPRQYKPSPRAFLQSPKNSTTSRRKISADSTFSSKALKTSRKTSHK